jgi:hypothetical protein
MMFHRMKLAVQNNIVHSYYKPVLSRWTDFLIQLQQQENIKPVLRLKTKILELYLRLI